MYRSDSLVGILALFVSHATASLTIFNIQRSSRDPQEVDEDRYRLPPAFRDYPVHCESLAQSVKQFSAFPHSKGLHEQDSGHQSYLGGLR